MEKVVPDGHILTRKMLEDVAKKIQGPIKTTQEQFLEHYDYEYKKEDLRYIYLIMPEEEYNTEKELLEGFGWIKASKYVDQILIVNTSSYPIPSY